MKRIPKVWIMDKRERRNMMVDRWTMYFLWFVVGIVCGLWWAMQWK